MSNKSPSFKVVPANGPLTKARPEAVEIEPARLAKNGEIPVIDVSCLQTGDEALMRIAADQIRSACERIGFFYIVNHGVRKEVIHNAFEQSREFFNQAEKTKQDLQFNSINRGYKAPGNITIPGYLPDLKEVLDLGVDLPSDHPDVITNKPLHGPNQWPALPGFKNALVTYFEEVSRLGNQLLRLFAMALDLDEKFFLPFHENAMITWRVMRYFPDNGATGQYGTAPHTDFGTITLLAQDDRGGLEVFCRNNEWIQAPYIQESLVVNIGDLMACWTNDRFTSTAHRVLNKSGQDRYSIPMFYNPTFDTVAECLPTCCDESNPPRYKPIHYGDYVTGIYKQIFSSK
ncbi:MAG: isopenicillin N synthase-like dioxygenase [Parasphingorhabdus sp.]|jgi:isopenicillin N synthase-like dioxygenase